MNELMRDVMDTPRDMSIRVFPVRFQREEGAGKEVQVAWYVETRFVIVDKECGTEHYTSPVIHSLC
ncbi:MAG TPA: hypothetical protein VJ123_08945 [Anaerolineales bacterium]|nr:hypothetical protein [Anaerolineales bacterium]